MRLKLRRGELLICLHLPILIVVELLREKRVVFGSFGLGLEVIFREMVGGRPSGVGVLVVRKIHQIIINIVKTSGWIVAAICQQMYFFK